MMLNRGDIVTFGETGTVKVNYGAGEKPEKMLVTQGEIWEVPKAVDLDGMPMQVSPSKTDRRLARRSGLMQKLRTCAESFASLEWPDTRDPLAMDLEARLEARGAALKARLLEAQARLKDG